MINIPSDLRKNKDKIIGEFDLRECICLFLELLLGIFILYYIRVVLGYKRIIIAAFIAGVFVIPFLFIGFKKINGMKVDDYFKVFINNKIIANSNRINICHYEERKVKSQKNEMIRYYRLNDANELLTLRQYLIDKNILILSEYIDYKNDKLAIFRLDATDLITEQIRRNKVAIEEKIKEIKEFINNEIKPVKAIKKPDTEDKIEFKTNKKQKLKKLSETLNKLKSEKKYLQCKSFYDLKEEVDIFEDIKNTKAERILVNNQVKKKKNEISDCYIANLRNILTEDERIINQLHLYNKDTLRSIVKSIDDKIVFINNENKVDVYYFGDINIDLVETNKLDKKSEIYNGTILRLEARNIYNHYRKINNLEEII